jgi:hypothetical protein
MEKSENGVRLIQALCGPKRHAIFALAYMPGMSAQGFNDDDIVLTTATAAPYLKQIVRGYLEKKLINPWCGLCGAQAEAWIYEDRTTVFNTLEEAYPHLRNIELKNLELLGQFYDRRHRQN